MKMKFLNYLVIMLLVLNLTTPAFADPPTPTEEVPEVGTPTEVPAVSGNGETPDTADPNTDSQAAVTSKELDGAKAKTLYGEVHATMLTIGIDGKESSLTLTDASKKIENVNHINELLLTQLKMYEILYSTDIEKELKKPMIYTTVKEGTEFATLEHLMTAYNNINEYLSKQVTTLVAEAEHNIHLVEALTMMQVKMTQFEADTIKTKPMSIEEIRLEMQKAINASTAMAIGPLLTYLNDGKDSEDITTLTSTELVETTKATISMVKQWGTLPHIENADPSILLQSMTSANQNWLDALATLLESMETTNGGATTGEAAVAETTNPALATSVLGRLGSSLFTVARSANADNDPNKPLTNTLGWTIDDSLKKGSKEFDFGPAAKDNFLAMFAATSVYTPMISKIGDVDYLEAYKALFNSSAEPLGNSDSKVRFEGNALGPIDILSQVQSLKKPLYYYNDLESLGVPTVYGNSTSDVKGYTTLLTVGDLMNAIKNKREIGAVTVHGVLAPSGDAWKFYNYSINQDGLTSSTVTSTTVPDTSAVVVDTETTETTEEADTTETTTETPTATGSNAAAGIPITNEIPADKEINAGQEQTRIVFEMTYNEKTPGAAFLTGALMHNIYENTTIKSRFKERANEAVYLDAVGNLVLNDGLIVLPAAANPTYWSIPNSTSAEGSYDQAETVTEVDEETGEEIEAEVVSDEVPVEASAVEGATQTWTYNPYTVAFMDSYPAIYQTGDSPSSANDSKDKSKYLMATYSDIAYGFVLAPIKKGFRETFTASRVASLYTKFKVDGIAEADDSLVEVLTGSIGVDSKKKIAKSAWYSLDSTQPIKFNNLVTTDGNSIFPYVNHTTWDPNAQESFNTAKPSYQSGIIIAKNMYAYIIGETEGTNPNTTAADGNSAGGSGTGLLREGFLFNNVTMPVLTGITSGTQFDKTNAKSDLLAAGGDTNVVSKWIINSSKWLSINAGSFSNILAVASPDDVSLLKILYGVTVDYGFYLVFILLVFLIILFIREGDFMAASLKGGVIVTLISLTFFVIPLFIPWLTAVTSSPFSRDTVIDTLMTKLELTDKIHTVEPAGSSGLSVKLYNMSPEQSKDMAKSHDIDQNYLTSEYAINSNLGMYIKGQEIRLDLYSFMRFNPLIIATSEGVSNPNEVSPMVPQIYNSNHSKSIYVESNESFDKDFQHNSDLVNFYMPYNLIQDGFVNTLNTYLTYYNPPQNVVRYPDGLVKSAYIMNTYMKSLAFLSAEPEIAGLISTEAEEDGYSHLGITKAEADLVNTHFYPYGDILGLQSWVDTEWTELPNYYASSLWSQNLYNTDYYDPVDGKHKRVKLANRVNRKAYEIIMRMSNSEGLVSDETLIKVISLYATFEFNKAISYQDAVIYPRDVTINEISATDILSSTLMGQTKQFQFYDTSLVTNLYESHNIPGLVAFCLATLALILYSITLSMILPTIIIGLVFSTIFLIITNRNIMPALQFVTKLVCLTILANLALVLTIKTYTIYSNIYVFSIILMALAVTFIYAFYWLVFKKKPANPLNWVRRSSGGVRNNRYRQRQPGYGDNSYEQYEEYYEPQGGRRSEGMRESSGGMNRGGNNDYDTRTQSTRDREY